MNSGAGGEAAKTKLTYSHTGGISPAGASLGRVIVCIIQVEDLRVNSGAAGFCPQPEQAFTRRTRTGTLPNAERKVER